MGATNLNTTNNEDQLSLQIANRYLVGENVKQICESLQISNDQVLTTLAKPNVQKFLTTSISNEEMQLHLIRIRRARGMIDTLLSRVENFINNEEFSIEQWKDSHISLIKDVLLNKLPMSIDKAVTAAIQINIGANAVSNNTSASDYISSNLKDLPPEIIIKFRDMMSELVKQLTKGKGFIIDEMNNVLAKYSNADVIEQDG